MGHGISHLMMDRDTLPDINNPPTYDPLYGFTEGREPRVMIATMAERDSARLNPDQYDYCAHKYIDLLACREKEFPLVYRCNPVKHSYSTCVHEDTVLRMKEFERERRLKARAKRINLHKKAIEA